MVVRYVSWLSSILPSSVLAPQLAISDVDRIRENQVGRFLTLDTPPKRVKSQESRTTPRELTYYKTM